MGYTPIVLPTNATLDRSESEAPPTTPRLLGDAAEFVETMKQLPLADQMSRLIRLYDEKYNPGRFMNHREAKEGYPLVADQFQQGGYENVIRDINERKQKALFNQNLVNHMPPGFLSGANKLGSFGLANMISPTNWGAGLVIEKTVGKAGLMLTSKIPETQWIAKTAAKFGFGALEGAGITTPIALSTYDYYNQLNMHMSGWDTLKMIGYGGGLGGVLRTLVGYRSPITPDTHMNAFAVAQDQMASEKKVAVGKVVEDGNFKARKLEAPSDIEALEIINKDAGERIKNTNEELTKEEKKFNELKEGKKNISELEKITKGKELTDKAEELGRIPEDLRTPAQNEFLKSLPNTDEMKAALTYKNIPKDELTGDQQAFLEKFDRGEEPELIKENIKFREAKIKEIESELKKDIPSEPIKDLKEARKQVKKNLRASKARLTELNKFERESEGIKKSRERVRELKNQRDGLAKMKEDTDAHMALLSSKHNPVGVDEVKAEADTVNSWQGDDDANLSDFNKAENDAAKPEVSEEEELKAAQATVDSLEKAGELGDFEKGELAALKIEEAQQTKINEALRDTIVCEVEVDT